LDRHCAGHSQQVSVEELTELPLDPVSVVLHANRSPAHIFMTGHARRRKSRRCQAETAGLKAAVG
jgi:hypothetical protein